MWKIINQFMRIVNKYICAFIIMAINDAFLVSCDNRRTHKIPQSSKNHTIEIREQGIGMIYFDRIPNERVMKSILDNGESKYYTFLVGYEDSLPITEKKRQIELQR